jgi:large subunit ribosomal protein L4
MATVEILNNEGAPAGSVELSDVVFGAEVNPRTIRVTYNQYMANQRAGTHSVKTRNTVSGGGKKPYKQKGTGRARQGSIRAAQWRGGGRVHGPSPRDYSYRINRKERRSAISGLLSAHLQNGTLRVVENLELPEVKTKRFLDLVGKLGMADARRLLVVTAKTDERLLLASRNVQHVKVINTDNINVFDLLTAYNVLMTREAAERLGELFSQAPVRYKEAAEADND